MAMRYYISSEEASFFINNKMGYGNAAPTSGNYKVGDFIISSTQANGVFGWVCTTAGNPGTWIEIGSGNKSGGKIVCITDSVRVTTPVNEVSLTGLGITVSDNDKLFVHYNSTHLLEGVHYEIVDGIKIRKLTEGNWNASGPEAFFAFELIKNIETLEGDKVKVDTTFTSKSSRVVVNSAVSEVTIGIENYNKDEDTLLAFVNSTFMIKDVDYEVNSDSTKIISKNGNWNEGNNANYTFAFIILKEIAAINPNAVVKTENIVDGSVTMDKLANDVKQAIEDAADIDLSGYATTAALNTTNNNVTTVTDKANSNATNIGTLSSLSTTAKGSLVAAINEVFQNVSNGKNLVASAITDKGVSTSNNATFSVMANNINSIATAKDVKVDGNSIGSNFSLESEYLWMELDLLSIDTYYATAINYNNEIHIIGVNSNRHYKYNNVDGCVNIGILPMNFSYGDVVVHNNEIHILGGRDNNTGHYKWNGSSWSSVSTLPYNFSDHHGAVVYNNEIHIINGNTVTARHYKLNGNSWVSVSTPPFGTCNGTVVVYNNEIHIIGGNWISSDMTKHCKWNGSTWIELDELPFSFRYSTAVVYNNEIHVVNNTGYHYKYNGTEWIKIDGISKPLSYSNLVLYDNNIHLIGGSSNTDDSKYHYRTKKVYSLIKQ